MRKREVKAWQTDRQSDDGTRIEQSFRPTPPVYVQNARRIKPCLIV
jgi:hypothetical protein